MGTKDTNALVLIPWTNGPTALSYGTNTITYRDWLGVYWAQTNNFTMTNVMQGTNMPTSFPINTNITHSTTLIGPVNPPFPIVPQLFNPQQSIYRLTNLQ